MNIWWQFEGENPRSFGGFGEQSTSNAAAAHGPIKWSTIWQILSSKNELDVNISKQKISNYSI